MTLASIVIPAYNNADYIAAALDSVLNQTFEDYEVVVADHASTDGTWEILRRYRNHPRVRLLKTEAGGGALRNWNRVSQAARGEYIKLVCGDDILYRDALSSQMQALLSHPGAALAASARDIVDSHGDPIIKRRGLSGLSGKMSGSVAVRASVRAGTNIFGEPACVMMRRDALEAAGWWDSRFPYLIDQATYTRVLLAGEFVALPLTVAAFRLSALQWSVRLAAEQSQQARNFHQWLNAEHPEVVNKSDVRIGNVRAHMMAASRRLLYAVLRRRLAGGL